MFPVQKAVHNPLLAPAPGPLPHGVAPGHYLGGSGPIILSNLNGMQVHILPIGATIQRLLVPNDKGVAEDVVLGFDDPTQYQVTTWHSSLTILAVLHPTRLEIDIREPALYLAAFAVKRSLRSAWLLCMQTNNTQYFGGIVGRVANRIANATFNLDGQTYHLGANDRCCS